MLQIDWGDIGSGDAIDFGDGAAGDTIDFGDEVSTFVKLLKINIYMLLVKNNTRWNNIRF